MSAIASRSKPPRATDKLIEAMTLVGHERSFYYGSDGKRVGNLIGVSISYFPDGRQMISGFGDKTVRLWDMEAGKEIEEARIVRKQQVRAVAVSRDGHWVITGGGTPVRLSPGELKACEVDTGIVKTFDGHSQQITCIDISFDSTQLASGSLDRTVRIWSLDTGELVAGPFETVDGIGAVRFSQDLKKLAVRSSTGKYLQVWDIRAQKLDRRVGESGGEFFTFVTFVPVFWTTTDRTIVTAFSFNTEDAKTIYEFDSSTLETVGTPFEGHTDPITGLALSFDCTLLASASFDRTIKLWALESRQLLASFDQGVTCSLVLSPDARQLVCTTPYKPGPPKIHIRDIPLDILTSIWPAHGTPHTNAHQNSLISDPLHSDAARRFVAVRPNAVSSSVAPWPLKPPPTTYPLQPALLHHIRKFLSPPFGKNAVPFVRSDKPHDPLDVPATSRLSPDDSMHIATPVHPRMNADEIPRPPEAPPITLTPAAASANVRFSLRLLSNWWPIRAGHASPPIVGVPLTRGKERNAAAGGRRGNGGYRRDEDVGTPPPLPSSDSQRSSAPALVNAGEHGTSCLCF